MMKSILPTEMLPMPTSNLANHILFCSKAGTRERERERELLWNIL